MSNTELVAVLDKMADLIERSERRIDLTNRMINQLASVVSDMAVTYDEHLTRLEQSKSDIIKQNTILVEMIAEDKKSYNCILAMQEQLSRAIFDSQRVQISDF